MLDECEKWNQKSPSLRWLGVMRGILLNVTGHCTALKSLIVRKVSNRTKSECYLVRYVEEQRLFSWGKAFIASVKDTRDFQLFSRGRDMKNELEPGYILSGAWT